MNKISILLVDDEVLLRQGLRLMLEQEPFVGKISEAGDASEFAKQLAGDNFDYVLLDIKLQGESGFELLEVLKKSKQKAKVVAVTGMDGVELIVNLLKAGCLGIVYKLNGYREILKTIEALIEGESYFPEKVRKIIQANSKRWDNVPPVSLSFHEMELLKAIANGATTKQIANDLRLPDSTAETYRIRLMKKLGVVNTASLLAYAYRNGIL
jgi:DNA-binding NarL/FixJ family response regulator